MLGFTRSYGRRLPSRRRATGLRRERRRERVGVVNRSDYAFNRSCPSKERTHILWFAQPQIHSGRAGESHDKRLRRAQRPYRHNSRIHGNRRDGVALQIDAFERCET